MTRDTILDYFIRLQIGNHREPERKGVPKGERIGFTLKKFTSILLSLTLLDLKEIADLVDVSYGLLRVWRTESEYQKERQRLIRDFSLMFAEKLKKFTFKQFEKKVVVQAKLPKNVLRDDDLSLVLFSDIIVYHEDVLEQIMNMVKQLDLKQYRFLKGVEVGLFMMSLATVWGIRKGLVDITKDGRYEFSPDILAESPKTDLAKVLKVADALQKPWMASKEVVDAAMTSFVKKLAI